MAYTTDQITQLVNQYKTQLAQKGTTLSAAQESQLKSAMTAGGSESTRTAVGDTLTKYINAYNASTAGTSGTTAAPTQPTTTGYIPGYKAPTATPNASSGVKTVTLPGGGTTTVYSGTGTSTAGTGAGFNNSTSAGQYLNELYAARPKFVQQTADLIKDYGPSSREAILQASPELAAVSQHITSTYSDPFGGALETYQDAIRSAQAARGFTGGGTGVVGEEARYLTAYATQRKDAMASLAQSQGTTLLGVAGLTQDTGLNLSSLVNANVAGGTLALQNKQYESELDAAQKSADTAKQMYEEQIAALKQQAAAIQQQSVPTTGAGSPFGNLSGILTDQARSLTYAGAGNRVPSMIGS